MRRTVCSALALVAFSVALAAAPRAHAQSACAQLGVNCSHPASGGRPSSPAGNGGNNGAPAAPSEPSPAEVARSAAHAMEDRGMADYGAGYAALIAPNGDLDDAIRRFQAARDAYLGARFYSTSSRLERRADQARRGIAAALNAKAARLYREGRLAEALALFEQALREDAADDANRQKFLRNRDALQAEMSCRSGSSPCGKAAPSGVPPPPPVASRPGSTFRIQIEPPLPLMLAQDRKIPPDWLSAKRKELLDKLSGKAKDALAKAAGVEDVWSKVKDAAGVRKLLEANNAKILGDIQQTTVTNGCFAPGASCDVSAVTALPEERGRQVQQGTMNKIWELMGAKPPPVPPPPQD
jgi:tetratricopeptide (TPR) repeat protein